MLEKLRKNELLHLLTAVHDEKYIITQFKETRIWQEQHGVKCWDCILIENKLNGLGKGE